ncbi:MAG: hypothetical protein R3C28_06410 [Pirellulaceae bacterium]
MDQEAKFVAVPLYDGELGIGSGHSPMIGQWGFGELRTSRPTARQIATMLTVVLVQVADDTVSCSLSDVFWPKSWIKLD